MLRHKVEAKLHTDSVHEETRKTLLEIDLYIDNCSFVIISWLPWHIYVRSTGALKNT
jgi:hypothetical protein